MAKAKCPICGGRGCSGCDGDGMIETPPTPPTTVRGWLETLPEPIRSEALKEWGNKAESDKHEIKNLSWAIWNVVELYAPFSKRSEYWVGVHGYLQGNAPNNEQRDGYNAAKAAFEIAKSQQNPLSITSVGWNDNDYGDRKMKLVLGEVPENGVGMSLQASVDGKNFVDVTLQNPSYVAIDPQELDLLRRKAAAWDTFSPKFQYLSDFYNDLKGLKV